MVIVIRKLTGPCFVPGLPHVSHASTRPLIAASRHCKLTFASSRQRTPALFNSLLQNIACGIPGTKTGRPVLCTRITACGSGLDQASFCLEAPQALFNSLFQNACGIPGTTTDRPVLRTRITKINVSQVGLRPFRATTHPRLVPLPSLQRERIGDLESQTSILPHCV